MSKSENLKLLIFSQKLNYSITDVQGHEFGAFWNNEHFRNSLNIFASWDQLLWLNSQNPFKR